MLKTFLPEEDLINIYVDNDSIYSVKNRLRAIDLAMDLSYPVLHLGTERVRQLAIYFERFLRQNNVRFQLETKSKRLSHFLTQLKSNLKKEQIINLYDVSISLLLSGKVVMTGFETNLNRIILFSTLIFQISV